LSTTRGIEIVRNQKRAWRRAKRLWNNWLSGFLINSTAAAMCFDPDLKSGGGLAADSRLPPCRHIMTNRLVEKRPEILHRLSDGAVKVDEAGRTSISCSSLVWVRSNLGVPVTACLPDPLPLSSDDRNRLASRRRLKVRARRQPQGHPSGS
jgi:hypothetical protein